MKTTLTSASVQKLRSGHTVWRCQIQEDGTVDIEELLLKGSKFKVSFRSMFPENVPENKRKVLFTSTKVGPLDKNLWPKGNYLSDMCGGYSIYSFRTRRAAYRWKEEVEEGLHEELLKDARDHWYSCSNMYYPTDDYDEGYDYSLSPVDVV